MEKGLLQEIVNSIIDFNATHRDEKIILEIHKSKIEFRFYNEISKIRTNINNLNTYIIAHTDKDLKKILEFIKNL